jgi:hypothetical protein
MENGQTPEGGQAPPPDGQAPQSFNIDGQDYTIEDIKSWQDSHNNKSSWESSYKQRDQEFADRRRELDKFEELDNYLRERPDLIGKVQQVFQEDYNQQQGQQIPDGIQELKRDIDSRLMNLDQRQSTFELDNTVKDLQVKYKQYFDEDPELMKTLFKTADSQKIYTPAALEGVLKNILFDKLQTDYVQQISKRKQSTSDFQAGTSKPGGAAEKRGAPSIKNADGSLKSQEEISKLMNDDPRFDEMVEE